jgi:predicted MFS family arabinose efflux permease
MDGPDVHDRSEAPPPLRRNRDFMLLWTGQLVSALGSRISSVAFPLLVLALTNSPAKAGLVGFAGTLPLLLFQLPAGGLVDRWNRKRAMIVCDVGRGLALGSLGIGLLAGYLPFAQIVAVAFVEGTLFVVFSVSEQAALPQVVPARQLPSALAQNEARTRGASLLGQPLGGVLFGVAQSLPFVADAVSYLASVVTLFFVRAQLQEKRSEPPLRLHREIAEGVAWLWRQPFLRAVAFLVAGSNLVFQAIVLVLIVLAQDRGASPAMVGIVLGLLGGGGFLGAFVAPWVNRHVPAKAVIIWANWLWAALLPFFAVISSPLALGVLAGMMAFVGPAWNVVVDTYALTLTPDRLRGRVGSVVLMIAWGTIPIGSLVAGIALQSLGGAGATLSFAAFMALIAVAATISPAVRHAPSLESITDPA